MSLTLALASCSFQQQTGFLRVDAPTKGAFEIYRIASESPLQFVSEQVGNFNETVSLQAGSYLILADCSSETVVIYPGKTKNLLVHKVNFIPALAPALDDRFSIQCVRSEKTRSRQHIEGRFSLNVLDGRHDLLVGMLPLEISFDEADLSNDQRIKSFRLSALKVAGGENGPLGSSKGRPNVDFNVPFFVSPANELVSVTDPQAFGHWHYLLAGKYQVEVNGTRSEVELAEGEQRTIRPAFLRVSTSDKINLDLSSQIRGSPHFLEINGGHWLNLNETYPVLPGLSQVRLNGSNHGIDVELGEGEFLDLQAKSVTVDLGCSPWEWNCLGDRTVMLYLPEQPYPFLEGVTDVPMLYLEDQVLLGIEGSKDIRYKLPKALRDHTLKVGYVELTPNPTSAKGQLTDLVRIEATDVGAEGHTLDIPLDQPTRMPVVAGTYQLAQYVMSTTVEGDRRRSAQGFHVSAGQTTHLHFTALLTERRLALLLKQQQERLGPKSSGPSQAKAKGYDFAAPLELL